MKFRLLLALLLLVPMPVLARDVPGEVTVNEDFSDSTYQDGLTISGGNTDAYIYCDEQGHYNTSGCSLAITSGTYVFEFTEDVYEVGFIVGAVNNSYTVKYYYSDGTDESIDKSGQDNSEGLPWPNMYDSFYKSFTDYNNDETNTDKFITKFKVTLSDISVVDTLYWQYVDVSTIPTTTTTTTTVPPTTTTTTTTTTTIPPKTAEEIKAEEEAADRYQAEVKEEQSKQNFEETGYYETDSERQYREDNPEIFEAIEKEEEETAIRDEQRKSNEEKYGCFMTDAQIERGDCKLPEEDKEEDTLFKQEEKDIIVVDDTKKELPDDDVVVLEVESKDEDKEFIEPPKEEVIEFTEEELEEIKFEEVKEEVKEFIEDIVIEEEVFEIPEEIIIVLPEEPIEEIVEDELDQEILRDDTIREEEVQEEDGTELEQVQDILVSVEEEDIEEYVEKLETEEVIEIVESVVEVGVSEITEEEVAVVTEVVEQAIEDVEELTEEQVEVVAEVLSVEKEDVEIIAETAKDDEVIAEAVEVFVQKAVENKDVEDYTFADVVTEIQFDNFIENPIEVLVDFEDIDLSTIGQDMTQDQKEKAQEVVVPVILTRIASMAAFVFRRS